MLRSIWLAAALLTLAWLPGCDNDPAKGKTPAKVSAPVAVADRPEHTTTQLGTATAATKYAFSNANSKLEFVGAKLTKKHEGAFNVFSGAIELVEGDLARSVVSVEIATGSLTADDPKLTGHLKSADFLDVEKFPKASFVSTDLKAGGEGGATHTVTGNLTIHGVTKSVRFPVKVTLEKDGLVARAEFVIDRRDFGVVYPGMPDDLIKDAVLLRATVHAVQVPR